MDSALLRLRRATGPTRNSPFSALTPFFLLIEAHPLPSNGSQDNHSHPLEDRAATKAMKGSPSADLDAMRGFCLLLTFPHPPSPALFLLSLHCSYLILLDLSLRAPVRLRLASLRPHVINFSLLSRRPFPSSCRLLLPRTPSATAHHATRRTLCTSYTSLSRGKQKRADVDRYQLTLDLEREQKPGIDEERLAVRRRDRSRARGRRR